MWISVRFVGVLRLRLSDGAVMGAFPIVDGLGATAGFLGPMTFDGATFLGSDFAGNFNLIDDAEGFDLTFAQPTLALGLFVLSLDESPGPRSWMRRESR